MKMKLLCVVFAWAGCNSPDAPEVCSIACTTDAVCPTGQTCGELGMCTDGTACPCEAGAFLGCVDEDEAALFCNATADGIASEACIGGCNSDAGRCNTCVPNTAACSGDMATVDRCGEDGVTITSDECVLGCVAATETTPIHCGYLEPAFLPDVCDEPATMATLDLDSIPMLDTNLDSICTGGIVDQPAPHPDVCVLRYGAVSIHGATTTRVSGARALAIVADTAITVTSTIHASAIGTTSGPGGSWSASGMAPGLARGAGGAGFRTAGAAGGQNGAGTGGSGGAVLVPDDTTGIVGGPRGGTYSTATTGVFGGGGGGAVVLIACRGTVEVSGTIHANGGGGGGGRDIALTTAVSVYGAGGGGAGGLVVLQGARVVLTGRLYANGGGGGAACSPSGDGCSGNPGQDGQLSTTAAAGAVTGDELGNGRGGNGGASTNPTDGFGGSLPAGGGGGSTGYLRIYTPDGVTPTTTPIQVSPSIEAKTVPTR